jgi:hypothetical protein
MYSASFRLASSLAQHACASICLNIEGVIEGLMGTCLEKQPRSLLKYWSGRTNQNADSDADPAV